MNLLQYFNGTDDLQQQLMLTSVLLLFYFLTRNIAARLIKGYGKRHNISIPRVIYTIKYFNFVIVVLCLMLLGLIWDISFQGLSVYFLSFFTVAGVALFASWSILSNITSAVILFFYFPYRIGSRIRIIDGDNTVEGTVYDLNLFSIVIKTDKGEKVSYPNNLAMQKAIKLIKD